MNTDTLQPIETAPKDGTQVLLFWFEEASGYFGSSFPARDCYAIGAWEKSERDDYEPVEGGLFRKIKVPYFEGWRNLNEGMSIFPKPLKPTHWMPLPKLT